jgi:enamine deaminase RidA (YjgF/YER057c/UK114 family)
MSIPNRPSQASHHSGKMPACETAVEYLPVECPDRNVVARVSRFHNAEGATEYHLSVCLSGGQGDAVFRLARAYQHVLDSVGISASSAIFRRVFCSDVVNQSEIANHPLLGSLAGNGCAVSIVGQSPLPAAKFSLWAYHLSDAGADPGKSLEGNTLLCRRGELTHCWSVGMTGCGADDSHGQTLNILQDYDAWLHSQSMNMADHVVRTWWFLQNIDADYHGLVEVRRDFFHTHGLNADTHYIASTGIAGAHKDVKAKVALDSYAIQGLRSDQLVYISAPGHLCPTYEYGVTFERATAVDFSDRRHVYVSGTASIDHTGRILHEGDVIRQLDRTLENVESLLESARSDLGDLAVILVYLRDPADGAVVDAALRERLGMVPCVLVHAPVCRPGWLIEIEGVAVIPAYLPHLPDF